MKLKKAIQEKTGFKVRKLSLNGSGVLTFNKHTTEEMKLLGKSIDLYQDEDKPADWYLHIANDASLPLRVNQATAQLSCTSICNDIKRSNGHLLKKTLTCLIAAEPIEEGGMKLYPLLITKGTH